MSTDTPTENGESPNPETAARETLESIAGGNVEGVNDEYVQLMADIATRQDHQTRYAIAQALGENLPADKDYYEVFSWDEDPGVDQFYALALRNPYGFAVTFLGPTIDWRDSPQIIDQAESESDTQTQFEKAVKELDDRIRLWHYAQRAHKLSGIGRYGALVLEFDDIDSKDGLADPVGNATRLKGMRPFSRASITDLELGGPGTDRWGKPVEYEFDLSDETESGALVEDDAGGDTVSVNWQRVIHIPSDGGLLDDEIRGVERQRPVYNNLIDIERTLGAAGHLAYRAAAWGLNINIDKDFDLEDGGDELREHLNEWRYGGEDILRTHGAQDVKSLGGENIDPGPVIDSNIEAISAQTRWPQSFLKGNETGERATQEDLKEVYGASAENRRQFINPQIVRPLLDRCITFGILPRPRGEGYTIDWPSHTETSASDKAEIRTMRAETLKAWPLADQYLTPEQQLEFIRDGELPSELSGSQLPQIDESDPEVDAQFSGAFQTEQD